MAKRAGLSQIRASTGSLGMAVNFVPLLSEAAMILLYVAKKFAAFSGYTLVGLNRGTGCRTRN